MDRADDGSTRYRTVPHVSSTRAAGATVLLDLEAGKYYTLNEVAGRLWEILTEGATLEVLLAVLGSEYDVPREKLEADVLAILEQFLRTKLIVREVAV